ncbi:NAD(P)H-dependent oxidoreductase [Achromobacter sp. GG226]|uniref:NAD(P)H-dependent oxidoreductase n=1 Tax=Verticiella alkaliphila TaxID=2779529 RepID=UPI001C0C78B5|nr:NAD(P)H-dependent oxidoreductase [Verticiella sp. GG226]MBU4613155.1 NAD(P)H-dependent oxidoreductase [Verticiella sp. GG226]
MHALVVIAHPNPNSLTHAIANHVTQGITCPHTFEIADLTAEGFDPRYNTEDVDHFHQRIPAPKDVAAEQARLDRADALVLVFPIYWWSFPGMLKGWIDRVFARGWAYAERPDGTLVQKLQRLPIHLVAVGGADAGTFTRHGYDTAMKAQIEHGIFGYCGAPVVQSEFLLNTDAGAQDGHFAQAKAIGAQVFAAPH